VKDPIVDVNVDLGRWPTRRVPEDDPRRLAEKLATYGVTEAWAGSFDGLFQQDLSASNARLAAECREEKRVRFVPFGSVNPASPSWEEDLRTCAETHRMPGIRLHPNYHGYGLDHPDFARLLRAAASRGLIVALAPLMEDERMMHPMLRVPVVDLSPLSDIVTATPGLRLILINALQKLRGDDRHKLLRAGEVYVEISMLEGVAGLANLFGEVPAERVLFGSHAPSLYFESAWLKLREAPLAATHVRMLATENARRLLPPKT
jgi:uncharacterized protein